MKLLTLGIWLGCASLAFAVPQSVTLSGGGLEATAVFDVVGGNLQVTLTNSSTGDVGVPADVLTGVFFSLPSLPATLTTVSAVLNTGSTVFFDADGQPAGGVVGGEFAYATNFNAGSVNYAHGISSAGLGIFGNANFPGANLDGQTAVNGLNYGITSAGDNTGTGNAAVTGGNPLIKSSVIFTLSGLPVGFVLNDLNGLVLAFQYGTDLSEPRLTPEPGFYGLLALGMAGIFIAVRRKTAVAENRG